MTAIELFLTGLEELGNRVDATLSGCNTKCTLTMHIFGVAGPALLRSYRGWRFPLSIERFLFRPVKSHHDVIGPSAANSNRRQHRLQDCGRRSEKILVLVLKLARFGPLAMQHTDSLGRFDE